MIGDVPSVIMVSVRYDRIAVIGAALDQIDLVAALRAHFLLPKLSRSVEGDAEEIAVTERPDLRRHAAVRLRGVGEGIVGGNAAVWLQPNNLAEIFVHILGGVEFLPLSRRNEEILAIGRKGEAMRKMAAARNLGVLLPDDFEPFDARRIPVHELCLADHGAKAVARTRLYPA